MQRFFGFLIILFLWTGDSGRATVLGINDSVQQSLRTGSAKQLAAHFATNIELIIDSEAIEFPSLQATHAELILKSFFRKYPPRRFQYIYQGTSDHQRYFKGTYQTGQERFQVYVLMREMSDHNGGEHQYEINTLHFRKAS